ncbi:MAG: zinc-binding dehydrogenase, partial [Candidatus Hodarchaeota archaeon]
IIGHEFSGIVEKIGKKVKNYAPHLEKGTPVTAQCVINCGYCESCKEGNFDDCMQNEERGFSIDGSMAEYAKADMRHLYSLENLINNYGEEEIFTAGALLEPVAGVYKAIVKIAKGLTPGNNAVVIGGGPIGLSAVAVLNVIGASKIILSEPSKQRREIARLLGANYVIDPTKGNMIQEIVSYTKNEGAEIIFEAAGVANYVYNDLEQFFKYSKQKSKLICFGRCIKPMKVDSQTLVGTYAMLTGSHGHCGVWNEVIRLVASKKIDPLPMITKIIGLSDAPKYLKKLRKDKSEVKVMVKGG